MPITTSCYVVIIENSYLVDWCYELTCGHRSAIKSKLIMLRIQLDN